MTLTEKWAAQGLEIWESKKLPNKDPAPILLQ